MLTRLRHSRRLRQRRLRHVWTLRRRFLLTVRSASERAPFLARAFSIVRKDETRREASAAPIHASMLSITRHSVFLRLPSSSAATSNACVAPA
jgi:hypothetical protein